MNDKETSPLEKVIGWMLTGAIATILLLLLIQGYEAEIRLEQTERTLQLLD